MSKTKKGTAGTIEAVAYISGIARELRGMAVEHNLDFLAYLLAMADDEAQATVRRLNDRNSDTKAA